MPHSYRYMLKYGNKEHEMVIRYHFTCNTMNNTPEVVSLKQIIPCFSCESSVFRQNLSSFCLEWLLPAVTLSNNFSTKGSSGTTTFSTHSSSSLSSSLPCKLQSLWVRHTVFGLYSVNPHCHIIYLNSVFLCSLQINLTFHLLKCTGLSDTSSQE